MFSFFDIKPNLFSNFEWAYLDLFQTYLENMSIVYHALGKGVKIMSQRVAVASFITDMRPKQFILFLSQTFNSPYFLSALWRPILFSTYGSVVHNFLQAVKEKETLRRSYFLFVGAVVTNDVTVVLTSQSEWQVLVSSLHSFFFYIHLSPPACAELQIKTSGLQPWLSHCALSFSETLWAAYLHKV